MNVGALKQGDPGTLMTDTEALAYVAEGKKWKLPTEAQWKELFDTCIYEYSSTADGNGFLIICNSNGATIFLPAGCYLCKPDETGADPGIRYVDLTNKTPSFKTESTGDLSASQLVRMYAIRLVRK